MSSSNEAGKGSKHFGTVKDPIVEIFKISGSECVKKSQIDKIDIKNMVVRCTACLRQINHHDKELKKHRKLGVLVCKECYDFYGTSEFSEDESGSYNYCTWCGNGGKLFVCDFCPNAFCSTCVRRNFGRQEVSLMTKEGWKCYCCNPKKLKAKIAYCELILEYCANIKKKKRKKFTSKGLLKSTVGPMNCDEPQDFVLPALDQFDDACKTFHKRLEKLKQIGFSKSKSLKHVYSKMEEIVTSHKIRLKRTLKPFSNQCNMYTQSKMKKKDKIEETNVNGLVKTKKPSTAEIINLVSNSDSDTEAKDDPDFDPTSETVTESNKKSDSDLKDSDKPRNGTSVEKTSTEVEINNATHEDKTTNNESNYKATISFTSDSDSSGEGPCSKSKSKSETKKTSSTFGWIRLDGFSIDESEMKSSSSVEEIHEMAASEFSNHSDTEAKQDPDFDFISEIVTNKKSDFSLKDSDKPQNVGPSDKIPTEVEINNALDEDKANNNEDKTTNKESNYIAKVSLRKTSDSNDSEEESKSKSKSKSKTQENSSVPLDGFLIDESKMKSSSSVEEIHEMAATEFSEHSDTEAKQDPGFDSASKIVTKTYKKSDSSLKDSDKPQNVIAKKLRNRKVKFSENDSSGCIPLSSDERKAKRQKTPKPEVLDYHDSKLKLPVEEMHEIAATEFSDHSNAEAKQDPGFDPASKVVTKTYKNSDSSLKDSDKPQNVIAKKLRNRKLKFSENDTSGCIPPSSDERKAKRQKNPKPEVLDYHDPKLKLPVEEMHEIAATEFSDHGDSETKQDPGFDPASEIETKTYKKSNSSLKDSDKPQNVIVKKLRNRNMKFSGNDSSGCIPPSSDESKAKRQKILKPEVLDYIDPKLKLQTSVILEKCDDLLSNGKTVILLQTECKVADSEKEVKKLCKFPQKAVKRKRGESKPLEKKRKTPGNNILKKKA